MHSNKSNNEKGMIMKIDMNNAFNKLHHSFLLDILLKIDLCPSFIRWTLACICNPWISALVNGRSTFYFKGSRGLCQGFPLSPLICVIMIESLSRGVRKKRC